MEGMNEHDLEALSNAELETLDKKLDERHAEPAVHATTEEKNEIMSRFRKLLLDRIRIKLEREEALNRMARANMKQAAEAEELNFIRESMQSGFRGDIARARGLGAWNGRSLQREIQNLVSD